MVEDILANGMQWESGGDTPEELAAAAELKAEAFSKLLLVREQKYSAFVGVNNRVVVA